MLTRESAFPIASGWAVRRRSRSRRGSLFRLVHRGLALARLGSPHDERQRRKTRHNQRHDPETAFKAHRAGLSLHRPIRQRESLLAGRDRIVALGEKYAFHAAKPILEIGIAMT